MNSVIHISVISCFFLFVAFGLVGYFYAYNTVLGNIFLNFDPSDKLILTGRLGMGLTLMFGMPMSLLPCREAFFSLLKQIKAHRSNTLAAVAVEVPLGTDNMNEGKSLLHKSTSTTCHSVSSLDYASMNESNENLNRMETRSTCMEDDIEEMEIDMDVSVASSSGMSNTRNAFVHVFVTLAFATFGYIGAVFVPGVEYVWRILGSSMGMIIAFIVPALCYLKIRGHKGVRKTTAGAFLLLVFSIVAAIICTVKAVSSS